MRLVLFMGAGFSKSANFPLMREFSMFSQNLDGYEDHILCLHKCIEYAQRTRAYIQGDIYNVEYLMSVLSLAAITSPDLAFPSQGKSIRVGEALRKLKELVWRVYSRMDSIEAWEGAYRLFTRSLKQFLTRGDNSIDIITTNYDGLPEMIMFALDRKATMPVEFETLPLPRRDYAPRGYCSVSGIGGKKLYEKSGRKNLHKLHGSVNWFVKNEEKSWKVYCWDDTFPPSKEGKVFHKPFSASEAATIPEGYSPVIVPPSVIKEYQIPAIKKSWEDASKAIGDADKIIFIGYSFPPSDTIMKFFLGTSLANNHKGCRIIIIDKNANEVLKSLKEIFVDNICSYSIEQISAEFQNLFTVPFQPWTKFVDFIER